MCKRVTMFILVLYAFTSAYGQNLRLMTYNMRLDVASDGDNAWPNRKDLFVQQLIDHAPDIIGTQEGLPHQIQFIDEQLVEYDYIGIGRNGPEEEGEYSAVFYKKSEFSLVKSGTFWLSLTPDRPSLGWDAALPRICTYGLFEVRRSGEKIFVFNTHLDHVGVKARKNSLGVIEKMTKNLNPEEYPVVIMGDLNAEPDDEIILSFSKYYIDAKSINQGKLIMPIGTFNAFNTDIPATRRIDYIFLDSVNFEIQSYRVDGEPMGHSFPSDHFPVIVDVSLKK